MHPFCLLITLLTEIDSRYREPKIKIEMMTMKRQNKLGSYLAVTAGVGCAASVAEGAVVVTTFTPGTVTSYTVSGAGSSHTWSLLCDGRGCLVGSDNAGYVLDRYSWGFFAQGGGGLDYTIQVAGYYYAVYKGSSGAAFGAVVDGVTVNYMAVDFTGVDTVRESVAAFVFDGLGGGYIHAIARNDDNSSLSYTDGITAITSPVPEPSSLALLALGSVGLAARRRRKAA
jgi:hypothetical protein